MVSPPFSTSVAFDTIIRSNQINRPFDLGVTHHAKYLINYIYAISSCLLSAIYWAVVVLSGISFLTMITEGFTFFTFLLLLLEALARLFLLVDDVIDRPVERAVSRLLAIIILLATKAAVISTESVVVEVELDGTAVTSGGCVTSSPNEEGGGAR